MSNINGNTTLASNRDKMDRFLDRLRVSGNVFLSCKAAGVSRRTVYNWRNRWATFRDEWDDALEEACDILEMHAWKRATEGQSDKMIMFLLKAYRPQRFKENLRIEVSEIDNAIEQELARLADTGKSSISG